MFIHVLFTLSALLAVGGAFAVVYTKNLMHACVYLLGSLFGVAGLYATLGADFLAATQIVVYAGGVVVLMLFAIMLTGASQRDEEKKGFGLLKVASMGSPRTYIIAAFSVLVISLVVLKIIAGVVQGHTAGELPPFESTVEQIGILLVTDHVLAFEISSVLLLGALVGAAVISRPRRQR